MKLEQETFQDVRAVSHKTLERAMEAAKLSDCLRDEVRVLYRNWRLKGWFSVSVKRLDFTYNARRRQELKRFFDTSGLVKQVAGYTIGVQAIRYTFVLPGCSFVGQPCTTDMIVWEGAMFGYREPLVKIEKKYWWFQEIKAAFFKARCLAWRAACDRFGWSMAVDWDGSTKWGASVISGLGAVSLPCLSNETIAELSGGGERGKWWSEYFERIRGGISTFMVRIRSRCYHSLISCPRAIREMLTVEFRGETERMVAVDMSATYTSILVGCMPACAERSRLQQLLADRTFYHTLNDSLPEDQRYVDYAELKKEFQKQCLFWRDPRRSSRPLWCALERQFPELAWFIRELRHKHGVSGLSDYLTKREADLFIDNVLVRCNANGIPCIPVHDALLVPESVAQEVKRSLELFAKLAWGYVPGFKVS